MNLHGLIRAGLDCTNVDAIMLAYRASDSLRAGGGGGGGEGARWCVSTADSMRRSGSNKVDN